MTVYGQQKTSLKLGRLLAASLVLLASLVLAGTASAQNTPPTIVGAASTTPFLNVPSIGPALVSGVLADPTDPAKNFGIDFTVDDAETAVSALTVTATSDNPGVTPNANLVVTGSGATRNLKITPVGVGYATITVTVSDGTDQSTYTISYAASAASPKPARTRFYTQSSDASAAIAVDANYMFVGDDEDQKLRLYSRTQSGLPLNSFDMTANLGLTNFPKGDPIPREVDIEDATRVGNRIFWVASQSNASSGNLRPNRYRIFATDLTPAGKDSTLSYVGRYDFLRDDLIAWDSNNTHGLGANYYGLALSAGDGHAAEQEDGSGFNIEGATMVPGSLTTAYIGFRGPIVPASARTHALVVPVTNFSTLAIGNDPAGSAVFGAPIELDLGGRGIRALGNNGSQIVIVAGPTASTGDFRLYTWSGNPADAPVLRTANLSGLGPEAIVEVPSGPLTSSTVLQLLTDDGDTVWYNDNTAAKVLPDNFTKFRSDTIGLDNSAPNAPNQSVTTNEDQALPITLAATDVDSDTLTYTVVTQPTKGTLSGTGINLTYTPNANYFGPDSFTFKANDGALDSSAATVSINVVAVNDAPVNTLPPAQTTAEDTGLTFGVGNAIAIADVDAGGASLRVTLSVTNGRLSLSQITGLIFTVGDGTNNVAMTFSGTLTAINAALKDLKLTPNADFNGQSILSLTTNDNGNTGSGGAKEDNDSLVITVTPVNDAPIAQDQSVSTNEDTPKAIVLGATDVDSTGLTFTLVTQPAHGVLSGSGANLLYTPSANYNGADTFTFKAGDGLLTSNVATVTIAVSAVNDAPVAHDDAYSLAGSPALTVAAPGVLGNDSDVDANALHAIVVTQPAHGTLTLNTDGSFTYTPVAGYNGADSFTYKANDGTADSNLATVALTISDNGSPTVSLNLSSSTVTEGTPVTGTLTLSRPVSSSLTVTLLSSDETVATVPPSVMLAAGQTVATFTVTTLKNILATGPHTVTISSNAGAYGTASANLTVTDNETPTLTLMVVPNAINENSGPAAALATLTRNTPTAKALSVTLLNSNVKAVKAPATVVIPAGAASVTFFVAALDNRIINKPQVALLTARALNYKDGTAKLTVADNGKVTQDLKLTLAGGVTYIEQAGGQTVVGAITLSGTPLIKDLAITLASSDPKRVTAPISVLLKAGQTKVNFSFRVLDNTVADGAHQVWLTARALGFGSSAVSLTILDNDGPALSLSLPKTSVAENAGSLTATLTRLHVPVTAPLVVSLASSDKTRVTVPATVTILAGKAATTIKVTIINNQLVDGNHVITLTASKLGFLAGTTKLTVLDDDKALVPAPRSTIALSTASAASGIQLRFTGALDGESASDAAHYDVAINGQAVMIESASYDAATRSVTLALAEGALRSGAAVNVQWHDLADSRGATVSGQTKVTAR